MSSNKHKPSFDAGATKRIFNQDMGDVLAEPVTAAPRPEDQEIRVDVTLEDFEPYEHNPRLTLNAKYEEIKTSIRNSGLDTEFVLTKRHPSDPKYIERNGGGTRYRICQELWKETGDDQFYRHNCLFRPWTDELSVLISHGSENDSRAPLIWLENALHAERVMQCLIEKDSSVKSMSMRDKADLITSRGWTTTHTNLIYYAFTVETLLPSIRQTLLSGMGRRKVVELKNLQSKYRKFVKNQNSAKETAFETTFRASLAMHDGDDDFETAAFETTLIDNIAQLLQCSVDDVRFDLASAQLVSNGRGEPPAEAPVVSRKPEPKSPSVQAANESRKQSQGDTQTDSPSIDTSAAETPRAGTPDEPTGAPLDKAAEPQVADKSVLEAQLTSVRGRSQSAALMLLRDHKSLIASYEASEDSKYFLGFVLTEPPVFSLPAQWLSGVVYWRLYHLFIAAMRTEKSTGYLAGIRPDDLLELERQCDLDAISGSEGFDQGQAFEFQWRWNDLRVRHSAGLCNGPEEERAVQTLTSLDQDLLEHGRLVLQLRQSASESSSDGQG